MKEGPDIARIAALIGDPARANMLTALMSGKALTASEFAGEANVTLQTASAHLSKLDEGGLLRPRKQGRQKYFSLASDDVARVLEGLMGLAALSGHLRSRTGPNDPALRKARVCYNHLAGEMGIQLLESLVRRRYLRMGDDGLGLFDEGRAFVTDLGNRPRPSRGSKDAALPRVPRLERASLASGRQPGAGGPSSAASRTAAGRGASLAAASWRSHRKARQHLRAHFLSRRDDALAAAHSRKRPPRRRLAGC